MEVSSLSRFVVRFVIFMVLSASFIMPLCILGPEVPNKDLPSLAFAIGGIIGASIAIMFSFSTFTLQHLAELFSSQYLKKFIEDGWEKFFFVLLVFLTAASFSAPYFPQKYALGGLLFILFLAFYLIYELYLRLRERINPEDTLKKIKIDSIKELEEISKKINNRSHVENKIYDIKKADRTLNVAANYKTHFAIWQKPVLINVKCLYEIGLRLLAKNEIFSFNSTIAYIRDIHVKYLNLRNGYFIRTPTSFWGSYTCDDEGFTTEILELLQSIGERVIQEKRKENIYFLLNIYESIIDCASDIKYVDSLPSKSNPLLNFTLGYYMEFINKLLASKESDWIFEAAKSLSKVSNITLKKTDNLYVSDEINKMMQKFSVFFFTEKHRTLMEILERIYLDQIDVAWNKYARNRVFWEDLFKGIKQNIFLVLMLSESNKVRFLSSSNFSIGLLIWQKKSLTKILEIKDTKKRERALSNFIILLKRWSSSLLDFAREYGLDKTGMGISIIQSVKANLGIIYSIKDNFKDAENMSQIYMMQFSVLSWYFEKTDKVKGDSLFNLDCALNILLNEIHNNLKDECFDGGRLIDTYIRLVEQHFDKVGTGDEYTRPRIIEKLVYLGLLLNKHGNPSEEKVLSKMEKLNNEFLKSHKGSFQLCEEIYGLGRRLLCGDSLDDFEEVLRAAKVGERELKEFVGKINYCKGYDFANFDLIMKGPILPPN